MKTTYWTSDDGATVVHREPLSLEFHPADSITKGSWLPSAIVASSPRGLWSVIYDGALVAVTFQGHAGYHLQEGRVDQKTPILSPGVVSDTLVQVSISIHKQPRPVTIRMLDPGCDRNLSTRLMGDYVAQFGSGQDGIYHVLGHVCVRLDVERLARHAQETGRRLVNWNQAPPSLVECLLGHIETRSIR